MKKTAVQLSANGCTAVFVLNLEIETMWIYRSRQLNFTKRFQNANEAAMIIRGMVRIDRRVDSATLWQA